jgi:2-acylglycerol O-acyltransferase 1
MWADCYDYAARVEWLGIGIWGNRHAAPYWTGEEASQAILTVISDRSYAEKARALVKPREQEGRFIAARKIAQWAEQKKRGGRDAPLQTKNKPAPVEEEPAAMRSDEL